MSLFTSKAPAGPYWNLVHKASDSIDRSMRSAVSQSINELSAQSLAGLSKLPKVRSAVASIDWNEFEDTLAGRLNVRMTKAAIQSAKNTASRLKFEFDATSPAFRRIIDNRVEEAAALITKETKAAFTESLRSMVDEGLTPAQIRVRARNMLGMTKRQAAGSLRRATAMVEAGLKPKKVESALKRLALGSKKVRGFGISRFESLKAAQIAQDFVFNRAVKSGIIEEVLERWVAVRDKRTDKVCRRLHGQTVPRGKKFTDPKTGKRYSGPPDPHTSCRCGKHFFFRRIPKAQQEVA